MFIIGQYERAPNTTALESYNYQLKIIMLNISYLNEYIAYLHMRIQVLNIHKYPVKIRMLPKFWLMKNNEILFVFSWNPSNASQVVDIIHRRPDVLIMNLF